MEYTNRSHKFVTFQKRKELSGSPNTNNDEHLQLRAQFSGNDGIIFKIVGYAFVYESVKVSFDAWNISKKELIIGIII